MVNLKDLLALSEDDALEVFKQKEIIGTSKECRKRHLMIIKDIDGNFTWRCQKRGCNEKISVRKGNWLEGTNLKLTKILTFIYSWTKEYISIKFCKDELDMGHCQTVDFCSYMRELCASDLLNNPVEIGGPNMTVEIDETVYSRRKCNRGRSLPEQWIFNGICRETKECVFYAVLARNRETLQACIVANIRPGTKIISDCWKAYQGIDELKGYNFVHETVNHNENFVDPSSGAHTQNIGSLWNVAKRRNKRHCGTYRDMIDGYLCEFIWRQRYRNDNLYDIMLNLIAHYKQ